VARVAAIERGRAPIDIPGTLAWLGQRTIIGIDTWDGAVYTRTAALGRGRGRISLRATGRPGVEVAAWSERALAEARPRVRHLLGLDDDPRPWLAAFADDPVLGPRAAEHPGLRMPGAWDAWEMCARAVLGQLVSVAAARTLTMRLAERHGQRLPDGGVVFPTAATVAAGDLDGLGLPGARRDALRSLAELVARDGVDLAPGADPEAAQDALVALKGIGPWTAMYVRMRAIRDLDAFPAADLGVLVALADAQGRRPTAAEARRRGEAWRPYRGVATMHLWGLG
jgi:AraC family transcriptional regulator of adaptative response / DNA-3-methyladenine glycosylase II